MMTALDDIGVFFSKVQQEQKLIWTQMSEKSNSLSFDVAARSCSKENISNRYVGEKLRERL